MKTGTGNVATGRRISASFISVLAVILATAASAAAQTVAITGGKVYPVSGPLIENGTVLVRDGKIVAVGANVSVPNDATRIDATNSCAFRRSRRRSSKPPRENWPIALSTMFSRTESTAKMP